MIQADLLANDCILLMRHAKSSWSDSDLSDHDRPLNRRGERDAPRMAELLREQNLIPETVVTSSATRARETAENVCKKLGLPAPLIVPQLYHATVNDWQDVLATQSPPGLTLWVGHNPGLEELVLEFTGQDVTLPTAAIVAIRKSDGDQHGRLLQIWRPKEV